MRQNVAIGLLIPHVDIVGLAFKSDQALQRLAESLHRFNALQHTDDLVVNLVELVVTLVVLVKHQLSEPLQRGHIGALSAKLIKQCVRYLPRALDITAMLHAYIGDYLSSRFNQYAFIQSDFTAYLFAYLCFAYQIVSVFFQLGIQVT